jgi:hypothetical protein
MYICKYEFETLEIQPSIYGIMVASVRTYIHICTEIIFNSSTYLTFHL